MSQEIGQSTTGYIARMYSLRGFPCEMLHLGLGFFRLEGWDDQDRILVEYDQQDKCYTVERLI